MTKASRNDTKKYYQKVKKKNTVYVWNMNYPTIITRESIDKAYNDWYSCKKGNVGKYDRAYYDAKLQEGKGKPGSDCSGMDFGLSGYDTTAQGYYNRCSVRGNIECIPINDIVLLFKGTSPDNITHTGTYYGNGLCVHMKSSRENCVQESVDNHKWTFWGMPDFIDYGTDFNPGKPVLTRELVKGSRGVDVKFLQTLLNDIGYACGDVDGIFGKYTLSAVKRFQTDRKLESDGIVGKRTAKKLGFKWEG